MKAVSIFEIDDIPKWKISADIEDERCEQILRRVWDWKSFIFMDAFVGIRSVLSLSKSPFEKIRVDLLFW